ncbi:MAG: SlyX family protein [Luminiphilus sp.]
MNNQDTTEIITELETKIAFLEAANDDLERALLSQHERIDRLDVIVNELRNRIKEQASVIEGLEGVSSEPPPPHY